ncbi:MAG: DUF4388 domain-containing protein [Cyanobacteria bacterium HKST-UBA02]|nr:DUF4388 domain-containing protein [Cyanobacteria bacterium HKST-UBA02]
MNPDNKRETLSDRLKRAGVTTMAGQSHTDGSGSEAASMLQGELREKPISWLLQAAQHYEVTGHLLVGNPACTVNVQFGLGKPLHAYSPVGQGVAVVIDLFNWKDGKIRFEEGKQPEAASIQDTTEELLRQGNSFIEDLYFLEQNAISEVSFLLRPPGKLAPGELEARLARGASIDPRAQSDFFGNIYGTLNLKDIAERMGLRHDQWVTMAANLLRLGLLLAPDGRSLKLPDRDSIEVPMPVMPATGAETIPLSMPLPPPPPDREADAPRPPIVGWGAIEPQTPPAPAPVLASAPAEPPSPDVIMLGAPSNSIELEPARANAVWRILNNPETGILTFEVFQFFLDREFARARRFGTMLALTTFCVKPDTPDGSMPAEALAMLTGAVSTIKRDVDMLGHFGNRSFGLLLPNIESSQACNLADRISADLPGLAPDLARYKPSLHFGIASVPQDGTDLASLVSAAQKAMIAAANQNVLRLQACELG